jgi:hypothetical protein
VESIDNLHKKKHHAYEEISKKIGVQHQLREYRKSHNHDVVQEEAVQELAMHP